MVKKKVIILGAGGHAKVVLECLDHAQYEAVGFLDKDNMRQGEKVSGLPILGDDSDPAKWLSQGITCCIVGIGHMGNPKLRNKLYLTYRNAGYELVTAIHSTAQVSPHAKIGAGTVIMPGVILNADAVIGNNCIINTGAIIEHDAHISDGVHVAPGCIITGAVKICENSFVGAGSNVINGACIHHDCIIGAGSVVITDLPECSVSVGSPARIIKEKN